MYAVRVSWLFLAVWLTVSLSVVQGLDVKPQSVKDGGEDDIRDKLKELLRKLDKAADDGDDDDDDKLHLQEDDDDEPQPVNFYYGETADDEPQPTDDQDDKPEPYNMYENEEEDDDDELDIQADDDSPQPTVYSSLCGKPSVSPLASSTRIVGGVEARPHSWPWQCSLQIQSGLGEYYHACGASVISDAYVMTAALCVCYTESNQPKPTHLFRVVCGEHNLTVTEPAQQTVLVSQIIRHSHYDPSNMDSDVALILVTPYLTINSYVRPICLPASASYPPMNHLVTVTGWGVTLNTGSSKVLRQVSVPFIPTTDCFEYVLVPLTSNMVCAGGVGGKGMCFGDGGGPLVYYTGGRYELLGIASWFVGQCASPLYPGVYVNVRMFVTWIGSHTGVTPPHT